MITLYSRNPRIVKNVRDMCAPEHVKVSDEIPGKADLLVTMGWPTGKTELYACGLGAMVVKLPEHAEWTAERIKAGLWSVLCGADMYNAVPKRRR